jgi:FtsZ-interacting cell division protein YlmF
MDSIFAVLRKYVADNEIVFDVGMVERHPIKRFDLTEFEDASEVVDFLRDGGTAFVDASQIPDPDAAQRTIDFIAGAAFYGGHWQERYADRRFAFGDYDTIESSEFPDFSNVSPQTAG